MKVKEVLQDEWLVFKWLAWLMKVVGFRYFYRVNSPKLRNIVELLDRRLKLDVSDLFLMLQPSLSSHAPPLSFCFPLS